MRNHLKKALLGAVACTAAGAIANANELPTGNLNPAYFPSNVQAQLQVGVKPGTEAVHFIRDTSDSKIITKTDTRTYFLCFPAPFNNSRLNFISVLCIS